MSLPKNAQALYLAERLKAQRADYQSRALATSTQVSDLQTALAGTQQQLAELTQAMLVLAQNSSDITQDLDLLKKRTEKKPKSWDQVKDDIKTVWSSMCNDTNAFNTDVGATSFSRVATSFMSFGMAAPAQMHAAQREVYAHMKGLQAQHARLCAFIEYGYEVYPHEMDQFLATRYYMMIKKTLTTETVRIDIRRALTDDFLATIQRALLDMRCL